ncbi:unnamed protein product [Lactuca saligna]|uniref:Late embryogenesis abundant protein LEA-2 subgroup domain-containing protein n=1 Tax=Lactuca saligna TaxID=75948 RepID=A0AA35ZTG2_LACSI|nr:unnamed protein product [Lactuca saligna]
MHSPNEDLEGGRRRRNSPSCWTLFYAWVSFLIWTIVIFSLIFGIAFFAFVRSNLPDVKVHRLDVYKLDVIQPKNRNKDTQLAIDVELFVNVTNNNKKVTLVYDGMHVETKIEGFSLPKVHLKGFRQNPQTSHDLKIHPRELRSEVNDDDDATELKFSAKQHEMVLNLKMRGKIEFWFNGRMVSKLGLKVSCNSIEQSLIDQALAHNCHVKLNYFS